MNKMSLQRGVDPQKRLLEPTGAFFGEKKDQVSMHPKTGGCAEALPRGQNPPRATRVPAAQPGLHTQPRAPLTPSGGITPAPTDQGDGQKRSISPLRCPKRNQNRDLGQKQVLSPAPKPRRLPLFPAPCHHTRGIPPPLPRARHSPHRRSSGGGGGGRKPKSTRRPRGRLGQLTAATPRPARAVRVVVGGEGGGGPQRRHGPAPPFFPPVSPLLSSAPGAPGPTI